MAVTTIATTLIVAAKAWLVPFSPTYCLYISTGKVLYPSPIIRGVPKSANALINTRSAAASMVGIEREMMILKNLLIPLQPRLVDASIRELSIFLNAPFI